MVTALVQNTVKKDGPVTQAQGQLFSDKKVQIVKILSLIIAKEGRLLYKIRDGIN